MTKQELDRAVGVIENSALGDRMTLDEAIEIVNQSGELDIVPADGGSDALCRALTLLGIGIFIGLLLAGVILHFTE